MGSLVSWISSPSHFLHFLHMKESSRKYIMVNQHIDCFQINHWTSLLLHRQTEKNWEIFNPHGRLGPKYLTALHTLELSFSIISAHSLPKPQPVRVSMIMEILRCSQLEESGRSFTLSTEYPSFKTPPSRLLLSSENFLKTTPSPHP